MGKVTYDECFSTFGILDRVRSDKLLGPVRGFERGLSFVAQQCVSTGRKHFPAIDVDNRTTPIINDHAVAHCCTTAVQLAGPTNPDHNRSAV